MPKSAIIITIPKPCSENWEEMSAAERGRFCAVCQKTVIDFSALSDAEVVRITKDESKGGGLCGRYHESQLGREMVSYEPKYTFGAGIIKKIAASLLLLQTVAASVAAQAVHKPKTQQSKGLKDNKKAAETKRIISGCIVDIVTKEPLVGMEVRIMNSDIMSISGHAGKYTLQLPDSFAQSVISIKVSYTVQSGAEPDGTVILPEVLTLDSVLLVKHLNIYRCPLNQLAQVIATSYDIRKHVTQGEINRQHIMTRIEIPEKKSFFGQLFFKKWFRKKHKNDE